MKTISLFLALALSPLANATMSCKEYLALSDTERLVFIRGLHDGVASMLGISDAFATQLSATASTDEQTQGILAMSHLPRMFLSQGCCRTEREFEEAITKGCALQPSLPTGTVFIDTLSTKRDSVR